MDGSAPAALVHGSVRGALWRLVVPGMLSHLAIMAFVLTDLYFVSLLGDDALAAISFTTAINLTLCTIGTGLGLGVLTLVAKAQGRDDIPRLRAIATDGMILSVGLMTGLSAALTLSVRPVFSAMGAEGEVLALVEAYMLPCGLSFVLICVAMVSNGILRGRGDGRTPLVGVALMAGINMVLDPVLMFGLGPFPEMGLAGAAWGTVIAAGTGTVHGLWAQTIRSRTLTLAGLDRARLLASARALLGMATPSIMLNAVPQLGLAVVTAIAAHAGAAGVAAYATGDRLQMTLIALPLAFSDSLVAYVGQNVSAGRLERVREGVRHSIRSVLVATVVVVAVGIIFAEPLASLFTQDPAVDAGIRGYLRIALLGYGGMGIAMVVGSVFLATDRTVTAVGLVFGRIFGLMVPAAMLGVHFGGLTGMYAAVAGSQILAGVVAAVMCRRRLQQLEAPKVTRVTMTPRRPTWLGLDPSLA